MKLIVGTLKSNDKAPHFNSKLFGMSCSREPIRSRGELSSGIRHSRLWIHLWFLPAVWPYFSNFQNGNDNSIWVISLLSESNEAKPYTAHSSVPDPQSIPSCTSQGATSTDTREKTGTHSTVHVRHPVFENYWWVWKQRQERQWRHHWGWHRG